MKQSTRILRLDASASPTESTSRGLGDELLERILRHNPDSEIRERDLNRGAQFIDARWIEANLSASDTRSATARQRLAYSDELIAELQWADHILMTTPMYNFGVPATLKAWIDQVCRAGITFRYTANGPQGLLSGKRADIVITTGGAPLDSPVDFASGYLRQVLGFIGIDEVEIIAADRMNQNSEQSVARALQQIERRYPALAA
jgi:FMN-dependent NADH-azoreductase